MTLLLAPHWLPPPPPPPLALRMISQVSCLAPREVFFRVAKEMFADDNFNWGRVVALFYFACKLIIKVRRGTAPPSGRGVALQGGLRGPPKLGALR